MTGPEFLCDAYIMTDRYDYTPQPTVPPTPMLESDARTWAMLLHILAVVVMFMSGGFMSFAAPLVIWLLYRQRSALIDFHGRQNLNLQLTVLVVGILAIVLGVATLGFGFLITLPLFGAYWVYALVVSIIAAARAQSGIYYAIPFAIPFIR